MGIRITQVSKRFDDFLALDNVSLEVPSGALLALLGPSGSGKTTLLRIIAGLETPDGGSVRYDDQDVTDVGVRERNVGFVFQHYALFRHMSVFDNIAFGLKVRRWPAARARERVEKLLALIQLEGLERALPAQLSGGQRQRVALARALAAEPKVLLLDEPFGALDAKVRQELREWLRRLHDEIHVTSVFVTRCWAGSTSPTRSTRTTRRAPPPPSRAPTSWTSCARGTGARASRPRSRASRRPAPWSRYASTRKISACC